MVTRRKADKFPLWLHKATGQFGKKILGQYYYFGTDRDMALAEYVRVREDLEAGRTPRPENEGLIVADLCNRFLTARRRDVDSGELSGRMWSEYHRGCEQVVDAFGKKRLVEDLVPDDFGKLRAKHAKRLGVHAISKLVQVTRTLFKFAFDEGLIDVPIRYGNQFDKPSARSVRLERAKKGPKLINAETARYLIDAAPVQLRAMILLGLNCGFGQTDCAQLPRRAIHGEWLDFPRPKNGMPRRCWLWPETRAAIEAVHLVRPKPHNPNHEDLVFITIKRMPWVKFTDAGAGKRGNQNDSVCREFDKLVKAAGVTVPGGPYVLRHTFRTIVDDVPDRAAIDLIMGHNDPTMAGHYRERIDDARLKAVAERMRQWLLGTDSSAR